MKRLPAVISLVASAALGFLAVATCLGFSSAATPAVWHVAGFAWLVGLLGICSTDYSPRRPYEVRATASPRASVAAAPAVGRPARRSVAVEAMATLGLGDDPATVTMS